MALSELATDRNQPIQISMRDRPRWARSDHLPLSPREVNVGSRERAISALAGSAAAVLGLARRDVPGLLIAALGGALVYRGATGHCHAYRLLDIDTADEDAKLRASHGIHVVQSCLVAKSPEHLYAEWRQLDNLPNIMSHLESVEVIDERRSHWRVNAPTIAGGSIEWDAEIVEEVPNERITWKSLPGADVEHRGSVEFVGMPGERGTAIRVEMEYRLPAGRLGHWVASLLGPSPDARIREDLRRFKRLQEVGEVPTITGQPHGTCYGMGRLRGD